MSASNASANAVNSSAKPSQPVVSTPKKDEIITVQAEEVTRPDVNQILLKLEKANRLKTIRDDFKKKVDEYESFGILLGQGVGFRVVFQTFDEQEVEFTNSEVLKGFFSDQMDRANQHLAKLDKDLIDALLAA